jgi:anti-sigma regulatory factor (Ser/Thr protein kinase)
MKELSLHILDIAQNSISAGAKNIVVEVDENTVSNTFSIMIKDDGKGMTEDILHKVTDPYFTSRTTRKVGLGLPLFRQHAEMAGGNFSIESQPGQGTTVKAVFQHDHLDRAPLGDIAGVMVILVSSNPEIEWTYRHVINGNKYVFDTREVKEVLEDMPITEPSVGRYLKDMIRENLEELG